VSVRPHHDDLVVEGDAVGLLPAGQHVVDGAERENVAHPSNKAENHSDGDEDALLVRRLREKNGSFSELFLYVCPEPVLVKCSAFKYTMVQEKRRRRSYLEHDVRPDREEDAEVRHQREHVHHVDDHGLVLLGDVLDGVVAHGEAAEQRRDDPGPVDRLGHFKRNVRANNKRALHRYTHTHTRDQSQAVISTI
jgi:hypothetical protein